MIKVRKTILVKSCIQLFEYKGKVIIKGPLGVSFLSIPINFSLRRINSGFQLVNVGNSQFLMLTFNKLLSQKIRGVELGFFEILLIQGVGWQVSFKGNTLEFSVGFSYPVQYVLKLGVEVFVYSKQRFKLFGLDLYLIQQAVSDLCCLCLFNVYKGKGIYRQGKIHKLKVSSKSKA